MTSQLTTTVVPFLAGDGMALNLHHVTGPRPPVRGPVLLVHGAGVRADIFRPPGQQTLVDVLVDEGSGAHPQLPASAVAQAPQTDARFVLLAGRDNKCFLPESQARTFAFLDGHRPGHHALHLLKGYGHLDVLFGRNAARDTYPVILEGLRR